MPNFNPITNPMTRLITRRNLLYSAPRLEGDGKEKKDPCPNLMNLSRVRNPPKTGFN